MVDLNLDAREKINQAAMNVFGTMYFTPITLLTQFPDPQEWQNEKQFIKATISCSAPLTSNTMNFYFSGNLSRYIAETFLGSDSELSEQQVLDTMREAANMIAGSFLGAMDPMGSCRLGLPEAESLYDFNPESLVKIKEELLIFSSEYGLLWLTYSKG